MYQHVPTSCFPFYRPMPILLAKLLPNALAFLDCDYFKNIGCHSEITPYAFNDTAVLGFRLAGANLHTVSHVSISDNHQSLYLSRPVTRRSEWADYPRPTRLSTKGPFSQVKESIACNKIKISFCLTQSLLPNEVADSVRFQI